MMCENSFIDIGNLIFQRRYLEGISIGEDLLRKSNRNDFATRKMLHINLMVAYYKLREANPLNITYSTFHAKQAIICGHNTGLAQERLIINLEKSLLINQAIQVCELLLSENFNFSKTGYGNKEMFVVRLERLKRKLPKANDSKDDKAFSREEINLIFENSKPNWS